MEFFGKEKPVGDDGSVTIHLSVGSLARFTSAVLKRIDKVTSQQVPVPGGGNGKSNKKWKISHKTLNELGWGDIVFLVDVSAAALSEAKSASLFLIVTQDETALPAVDDKNKPANDPPDQDEVDLGPIPIGPHREKPFSISFAPRGLDQ
jgi:hypothetical protein